MSTQSVPLLALVEHAGSQSVRLLVLKVLASAQVSLIFFTRGTREHSVISALSDGKILEYSVISDYSK